MKKIIPFIIITVAIVGYGLQSDEIKTKLGLIEKECLDKVCALKTISNDPLKISFSTKSLENKTFIIGQCHKGNCELFGRLKCDAHKNCEPEGSHSIASVTNPHKHSLEISLNAAQKEGMTLVIE